MDLARAIEARDPYSSGTCGARDRDRRGHRRAARLGRGADRRPSHRRCAPRHRQAANVPDTVLRQARAARRGRSSISSARIRRGEARHGRPRGDAARGACRASFTTTSAGTAAATRPAAPARTSRRGPRARRRRRVRRDDIRPAVPSPALDDRRTRESRRAGDDRRAPVRPRDRGRRSFEHRMPLAAAARVRVTLWRDSASRANPVASMSATSRSVSKRFETANPTRGHRDGRRMAYEVGPRLDCDDDDLARPLSAGRSTTVGKLVVVEMQQRTGLEGRRASVRRPTVDRRADGRASEGSAPSAPSRSPSSWDEGRESCAGGPARRR